MNDTVAVVFSVHMFFGLIQTHEDEGRSVVIGACVQYQGDDDDEATERLTLFQ